MKKNSEQSRLHLIGNEIQSSRDEDFGKTRRGLMESIDCSKKVKLTNLEFTEGTATLET